MLIPRPLSNNVIRLWFGGILLFIASFHSGSTMAERPAQLQPEQLVEWKTLEPRRQQLIEVTLKVGRDFTLDQYIFGSADPSKGGFDCSGSMYYVLDKIGIKAPRSSSAQFEWIKNTGQLVDVPLTTTAIDDPIFAGLKPGDLLFWSGTYQPTDGRTNGVTHVQMYLGREQKDGRMVMIGSSDGRSYRGQRQAGYGVFDFVVPKESSKSRLIGYGPPPGLTAPTPKPTAMSTPKPPATPETTPTTSLTPEPTSKTTTGKAPAQLQPEELAEWITLESRRKQLIEVALKVGRDFTLDQYIFGSADPSKGGFDCSGSMYYVLDKIGIKAPRSSSEQFDWIKKSGKLVDVPLTTTAIDDPIFAGLKPGDLLFWSGTYQPTDGRTNGVTHVQMYLGREKKDGRMVMIGSSDGRSYRGQRQAGYGVFDFVVPKESSKSRLIGYGPPPGLTVTQSEPTAVATSKTPASREATPRPASKETPRPTPKTTPRPASKVTPRPTPKATARPTSKATPRATPKATPTKKRDSVSSKKATE